MKPKMTFAELAKLGMEALAKQGPVTLEEARKQVRELRKHSQSKNKKQRNKKAKDVHL